MNYLFDVDGTLTPNRLPIEPDFIEQFLSHLAWQIGFCSKNSATKADLTL